MEPRAGPGRASPKHSPNPNPNPRHSPRAGSSSGASGRSPRYERGGSGVGVPAEGALSSAGGAPGLGGAPCPKPDVLGVLQGWLCCPAMPGGAPRHCQLPAPRQSLGGLAQNLSKVWGTHLDPGLPTTPPTCPKTPLGCCAPAAPVPGWGSRTGIGSPGSDVPGPRKATAGPPRAKHGKISLSHPGAAGGGAPSPQKRTVPPTREFGVCFAPPPLSLSGLGLHALLRIPPRL